MIPLRDHLRRETAEAHNRLDASLSKHDLTTVSGLSDYLRVHYLARNFMDEPLSRLNLSQSNQLVLSQIEFDLNVLGQKPPAWDGDINSKASNFNSIGLTYVIAGSSLGSKLLYQNWSKSVDPKVKNAGRFMQLSKDSSDWVEFLTTAKTAEYSARERVDIVKSANYVFGVFSDASRQINSGRAHG